MFGVGGFELLVILLFGFLIFGPEKLPEIANTVGKFIARFRDAQKEAQDFSREVYDPTSSEPFKNPLDAMEKFVERHEADASKASTAGSAAPVAAAAAAASVQPDSAQPAEGADKAAAMAKSIHDSTENGTSGEAEHEDAPGQVAEQAALPREETFAERKARYERERAERRAAEAAAAAKDAGPEDGGVVADAGPADSGAAAPKNASDPAVEDGVIGAGSAPAAEGGDA